MAEQPTEEERRSWHRRFAVESNNRAWALVEKPELTGVDREELLRTAYASAHHWGVVGNGRNHALAAMLLALVHARLGHAGPAREHATATLTYFEQNPSEPWERAFAHAAMAAAAYIGGDQQGHLLHHTQASEIGDSLETEEKAIFMASFCRIPVPGR